MVSETMFQFAGIVFVCFAASCNHFPDGSPRRRILKSLTLSLALATGEALDFAHTISIKTFTALKNCLPLSFETRTPFFGIHETKQ